MKTFLASVLAFWITSACYAQTYFKANVPYVMDLSILPKNNATVVKRAFKGVSDFGIPFKYPQGGCESRAYAMALILDSLNIPNGRVWVFAPSISIAGSSEVLSIVDINDRSKTIVWTYHTAPVILAGNDNTTDTLVLDPSLNNSRPLKLREWFALMRGYQKARFTFTPDKCYSFYTNQTDKLINGNFFEYVDYSYNSMFVEKNLALDYVGRYIYGKYLKRGAPSYNENLISNIQPIVSNIYQFQDYILKNELPSSSNLTERQLYTLYPNFVVDCKNVFNREFIRWHRRIDRLSKISR